MAVLLRVSSVNKKGEGQFELHDISFVQKKYQKLAIVGETGSGKSTLLKIIAGLIQPDDGYILFEKGKVMGPSERLVPGHPSIAYLSQYFELQKFLTVAQILSYANHLSEKQSNELYNVCEIEQLLSRKTDQLSGGEKQRIAIARLLISSPRLLLLDEPFSHLDLAHKNVLKSVINNICEKLEITCILVSHDPADTLSWADKILVMKDGHLIQEGAPEKLYRLPANEYVAGLFGKYFIISSILTDELMSGSKKHIVKPFYRTHDFELTERTKDSIKGKVKKVEFYGGYYEIEIEISKSTIALRTVNRKINVGDIVYVALT